MTATAAPARTCSVDGCGREHKARTLCDMHYQRAKKSGDAPPRLREQRVGVCAHPGCGGAIQARGLCSMHYQRSRLGAPMDTPRRLQVRAGIDPTRRDAQGRKLCSHCREWKPEGQFSRSSKSRDGLRGQCRGCNRARRRAFKYGLAPEGFRAMFAAQGGRCASCGDEFTEDRLPVIDHDHGDGHVRGLLCGHCNTALGFMADDPDRLRAAAEYLERDRATQADA